MGRSCGCAVVQSCGRSVIWPVVQHTFLPAHVLELAGLQTVPKLRDCSALARQGVVVAAASVAHRMRRLLGGSTSRALPEDGVRHCASRPLLRLDHSRTRGLCRRLDAGRLLLHRSVAEDIYMHMQIGAKGHCASKTYVCTQAEVLVKVRLHAVKAGDEWCGNNNAIQHTRT